MKYILLFGFVLFNADLFAQKIISYNYTKKEGLLSNTVYSIFRSKDGYLWIATDRGISRYNGNEFKHYTLKDGLADIENFFFYEDKQKRIWVGSYNGNLSYIKNNIVYNYQNDTTLKTHTETPIISKIFENKDSSIIISFVNSSKVLLYKNSKPKVYNFVDPENPILSVQEIEFDGKSQFRIKAPFYDYLIDTANKILSKRKTNIGQILRSQNGNTAIEIDRKQRRIIVNGVSLYLDYQHTINTNINCIFNIGTTYYIGTDKGLFIADALSPGKIVYEFKDIIISHITEDITGSIWVSSLTNGIYQIPKDYQKIKFAHSIYNTQILNAIASNKNLYIEDFKNNITKISSITYQIDYLRNNLIENNASRARLLNFQNNLYVLFDSLIFKEATFFKKIYYPILHKKAISNDRQILLNHGYFVNLCNASFENIHRFSHRNDRIFDIALNETDAYYCTIDSVFHLVDTNSVALHSKHLSGYKSFFVWNQLIIGITHNSELRLIDLETDSLLFYRANILSIKQISNEKYVYVSDKNSFLLKLNTKDKRVVGVSNQIIRKDLIPQNFDFLLFANGRSYVFNDNNLTDFSDSLLESATIQNQIKIQSVLIDNQPFAFEKTMVVSESKASSISIHLQALFFELSNPEYYYSVVNKNAPDTLWSAFKTDVIDLYNISAGEYTFLIKNEFNEVKNLATFHITKPFYKRPEIIILFFLCMFSIAFYIFYKIIQTNKQLSTLEHKALTAEYKSLNSVLNPHFIFNTLSSLQVLIRENKNAIAEKYLLLLSNLIRLNMKNGIKEKVTLTREIEIVQKYLEIEKLRFKNQFDFTLNMQPNIESNDIFLPPLSIQPIVENSIKHGFFRVFDKPGFINIQIKQEGNFIYIIVQDNGQGIQNKIGAELNSQRLHSLEVIQKRFGYFKKLYNIDISIEIKNIEQAQNIIGTEVTLCIDLSKDETL